MWFRLEGIKALSTFSGPVQSGYSAERREGMARFDLGHFMTSPIFAQKLNSPQQANTTNWTILFSFLPSIDLRNQCSIRLLHNCYRQVEMTHV